MMQAKDLKDIRTECGLSQKAFAEELGLTPVFVGMMERGEKPIERRTELAARHVYAMRSRLYGTHQAEPLADDVPIAEAMIVWDRYGEVSPPVRVVGRGKDDDRYSSSYGACNAEWVYDDDAGRLTRLLSRFVELTVLDKIPPAEVHAAFSVIPEYRRAMSRGMFKEGVTDPTR